MEKSNSHYEDRVLSESSNFIVYTDKIDEESESFLETAKSYPIDFGTLKPMAVNIKNFGLPKIEPVNKNIDKNKLSIIANQYINFAIIEGILKQISATKEMTNKTKILESVINFINQYLKNSNYFYINSIQQYLRMVDESKKLYATMYKNELLAINSKQDINSLKIPFIDYSSIEIFIEQLKKVLHNNYYISLIFINDAQISEYSQQEVNNLISRSGKHTSIKLLTSDEDWNVYYDGTGEYIQDMFDFETLNLQEKKHKELIR